MSILKKGEASRSYAGTEMNAESSRSHVIYRVSIEAQDKEGASEADGSGDGAGSIRLSYLNLVDLAGADLIKYQCMLLSFPKVLCFRYNEWVCMFVYRMLFVCMHVCMYVLYTISALLQHCWTLI